MGEVPAFALAIGIVQVLAIPVVIWWMVQMHKHRKWLKANCPHPYGPGFCLVCESVVPFSPEGGAP